MTNETQGLLLVLLCTLLEGIGQVFLKKAALAGQAWQWTVAGLAMFAVQALLYTAALQFLPVNVAYPISALGFIFVTLFSQWLLNERVETRRWHGVLLIISGTFLVATRA